jgi:hypothetical protein
MRNLLHCSLPLLGLIVALSFSCCGRAPDAEISRKLQEAQGAFLQAENPSDYLQVAALYQEVLDRGFTNGAILFNQGNAFMRAGRSGLAVASYRRAERLRARDAHLQSNLELALGPNALPESRTLLDHLFFWQKWLSFPEKIYAAVSASGLTLMLALIGLFLSRSRTRRTITWAALAIAVVLTASALLDWYRHDVVRHGVVVVESVTARKGNAESFAPAFSAGLSEGSEFILVEDRGEWLRIRLPSGPEGWIERNAAAIY